MPGCSLTGHHCRGKAQDRPLDLALKEMPAIPSVLASSALAWGWRAWVPSPGPWRRGFLHCPPERCSWTGGAPSEEGGIRYLLRGPVGSQRWGSLISVPGEGFRERRMWLWPPCPAPVSGSQHLARTGGESWVLVHGNLLPLGPGPLPDVRRLRTVVPGAVETQHRW